MMSPVEPSEGVGVPASILLEPVESQEGGDSSVACSRRPLAGWKKALACTKFSSLFLPPKARGDNLFQILVLEAELPSWVLAFRSWECVFWLDC